MLGVHFSCTCFHLNYSRLVVGEIDLSTSGNFQCGRSSTYLTYGLCLYFKSLFPDNIKSKDNFVTLFGESLNLLAQKYNLNFMSGSGSGVKVI